METEAVMAELEAAQQAQRDAEMWAEEAPGRHVAEDIYTRVDEAWAVWEQVEE